MKSATRDMFDADKAPASELQLHVLRVQDVAGLSVKQLELKPGVNVIYGPNESGKSTLMHAIRTVLLQRAKAKDIARELSPLHAAGVPTIWLEFSFANTFYRLSKRFEGANANAASLYCDDELLQGDEVDQRLAELFGFTQNNRGIAAHSGLLGLLWVEQADLTPAAIDENADLSLRKGLNKMRAGSGLDSKVLQNALDDLLLNLLGEKGKPVKEYARALRQQEEVAQALQDAQLKEAQHVQNLQKTAELLQQLQQRKAEVDGLSAQEKSLSEALDALDTALAERVVQVQVFEQSRAQASAHQAELAHALQARAQQLASLQALRRQLLDSEAQAEKYQTELAGLQQDDAILQQQLQAARLDFATLDSRYKAALGAREHRYFQASVLQAQRLRHERAGLQQMFDELDVRANAHRRSAHEREIVSAALLSVLSRKKQAEQTQVELQLIGGNTKAIALEVDGIELEADTPVVVPAPAEVLLAGGAKLRISMPLPSNDRVAWDSLRRQIRDLMRHPTYAQEAVIAAVLSSDVKLAELDAAAQLLNKFGNEQADAERTRVEVTRELARMDKTLAALPSEVLNAVDSLQSFDSTDSQSAMPAKSAMPTHAALQQGADANDDAVFAALAEKQKHSKSVLDALEANARQRAEKTRRAQSLLEGQQQFLRSVQDQIRSVVPNPDSDSLMSGLDAAAHAHTQALAELQARQTATLNAANVDAHPDPKLAVEQVARDAQALQLQALRTNLSARQAELQAVNEAAARLDGIVSETGKTAWSQIREQQQARLQAAQAQAKALALRAKAASALSTRLQHAAQKFERQIQTPLRAAMKPYLQLCFGESADVNLGDDLSVLALIRTQGGVQEQMPAERLSLGAREQLHILTRIAFADVLKANGSPSFLVLDDVFAYSDAQRKAQIIKVLAQAGTRHQVLISSCRAGEWDALQQLIPVHFIELPARHVIDAA
jgi:energy-coupling factor transporter ATP-binding protein EcfA2